MRARLIVLFLVSLLICHVKAQISEGGLPPSFNYTSSLRSELAAVDVPITFNVEDLITVDEWKVSMGSPLRVAKLLPVGLTMENAGEWMVLPGGERIWQLRVQADGAIALMLYYKTFHIPEGGKLFIYNADKTHILGAYTHNTNPGKTYFATEFVAGDDLILEYVSSSSSNDLPRIEIEEIGYGYNHLTVKENSDLRSSGSCMVDINCSEGAAWQKEKAGVCRTIQKIGKGSYVCSGTLVNNTAEDFKPYVLMAYHCMESIVSSGAVEPEISSPEDMEQWIFYFNFERPGCSNTTQAQSKTITGCTKVASTPLDGGSDGLLLLLDKEIPSHYNVYYNGWDRRNLASQSGVSIHHPSGDYKKISTYTSKAEHTSWQGTDLSQGAQNAHWNVVFAATENGHAVTEGGSSGSPLFNQDHLVVGTLSGGTSTCSYLTGMNLYGKLYYHWDKFSTSDTARMDIWLDPLTTGVETLNGLSHTAAKPEPSDLQLTYRDNSVVLAWDAPASAEAPSHYNIYRINQLIGTSTSTTYTDVDVNVWGDVLYGVTAEYADGEESFILSGSVYVQELKAPADLEIEADDNTVSLSWNAPVYTQTISWSTSSPSSLLGSKKDTNVYFGHLWDTEDLEGLNNTTITDIEFYGDRNATYSLLLLQGGRKYTQSVATQRISGFLSVALTTPFVIDSSEELIVSIGSITSIDNVYPLACDAGPAVIGKGNLISEDGDEWFVLYGGTGDEENNYNFYLGTVISSEKGTINLSASSRTSKGLKRANSTSFSRNTLPVSTLRATALEFSDFQYPVAFPEVTGYNVYRNSTLLTPVPQIAQTYTDRQVSAGDYVYAVAAVYPGGESEKSLSPETPVSNEVISPDAVSLSPSIFSDHVRILNADRVNSVDIYAISGVLVRRITKPGEVINTSALAAGVYIFRLYTVDGIQTYQTIKK